MKSVLNEVGRTLHLHLFQNACPIGTDRFGAKLELLGRRGNRLAPGEVTQYLVLTRREARMQRLAGLTGHGVDDRLGQRGADVAPPAHHLA